MKQKFGCFDLVRIAGRDDVPQAHILGYTFRWTNSTCTTSEVWYTLYVEGEGEIEAPEAALQSVGRMEPPLAFDEIVVITPVDPENRHLTGKRGVMCGASWDPATGHWGYAVQLQDGVVWDFIDDELAGTGRFLTTEMIVKANKGRLNIDDPINHPRRTFPLPVNLDDL